MTSAAAPTRTVEDMLTWRLAVAGRLLRCHADARLTELGVAGPGLGLLLRLAEEEGLSQIELARRQRVEPPTVSRMVSRLARDGLVELRIEHADRRTTRVALTERGREVAAAGRVIVDEIEGRVFEGLDEADRDRLAGILDELIAVLARRAVTQ
ncbi:MAG TPA: MarR family transcriptional regulator [Miltoncostaeaceae bacterium]|nr:MarR family transcriptional regulator [Miltoncostaeaceae bacterium]